MAPQASFLVAAVQATPVYLDLAATTEKACALIAEAGAHGAKLAVFPEAFLPGYPDWVWSVPAGNGKLLSALYARLVANAVSVPDDTTARLCQAAAKAKVHVVMGMHERNTEASNASLYNTLLYISDTGEIIGKHRKLVPTGGERTVWARGDGRTMSAYQTSVGVLGGLICWENYMPLARQVMYEQGTQVYVAPTWDEGEVWVATLRHIAKEGGAFVIGCCMPLHIDDIPGELGLSGFYDQDVQWINPGGSCIIGPYGNILAGPLLEQEALLYAEVDPADTFGAKRMLDVAGHYARPDVLGLTLTK